MVARQLVDKKVFTHAVERLEADSTLLRCRDYPCIVFEGTSSVYQLNVGFRHFENFAVVKFDLE
jgi:hypothetical protein